MNPEPTTDELIDNLMWAARRVGFLVGLLSGGISGVILGYHLARLV